MRKVMAQSFNFPPVCLLHPVNAAGAAHTREGLCFISGGYSSSCIFSGNKFLK
jgi:hypothetical protein